MSSFSPVQHSRRTSCTFLYPLMIAQIFRIPWLWGHWWYSCTMATMACLHGAAHAARPHVHYAEVTSDNNHLWGTENFSKHFRRTATVPALPEECQSLMAFLHFLVFMKCNEKLKRIKEELRDAHGTEDYAVQKWQTIYHNIPWMSEILHGAPWHQQAWWQQALCCGWNCCG